MIFNFPPNFCMARSDELINFFNSDMLNSKSRYWVFTKNNPERVHQNFIDFGAFNTVPRYVVWQLERGEEGLKIVFFF